MRLSFRAKLQIAFAALGMSLAGALIYVASQAAEAAARERIDADFRRAESNFSQQLDAHIDAVVDATDAALSDPLFRGQLTKLSREASDTGLGGDGDATGLSDDDPSEGPDVREETHGIFASADLPLFRRYVVLALCDAEGTLLFSKALPKTFGESLAKLPLVHDVLINGDTAALLDGDDPALVAAGILPAGVSDDAYFVVGRRIATAQGVLGAVFAGERVSQRMLGEAELSSHSKVWFATNGDARRVYGRERDGAEGALVDQALRALPVMSLGEVRVGASDTSERDALLAIATPLLGIEVKGEKVIMGRALLARSLREELGPFKARMRTTLLVALSAALVLSLLIGTFLARRFSSAIRRLEEGARRVRGGSLDVAVPVTSHDEIGQLTESFNEMVAGLRQRDQIKATFKRYLSPAVVEDLLKNPEQLELGGRSAELSIFFSDLVGFTSLSEGRDAHELVSLLNEYFDAVGQTVVQRGGTLDKFAGDSVMCFFGAPIALPDHRARALLSGLDHLRVVDHLRIEWKKLGRPLIDCRIGINTGPVVVGNIGSRDGQDYTVIGDAVNLASRLEGANKEYGTRFMVSEETLRGAESVVEFRELDLLRVKGKQLPVRVFEVLGEKGQVSDNVLSLASRFHEALAAYRAQQFTSALAGFRSCLALKPDDGPSATFIERCIVFETSPPGAGWDGVCQLTSK